MAWFVGVLYVPFGLVCGILIRRFVVVEWCCWWLFGFVVVVVLRLGFDLQFAFVLGWCDLCFLFSLLFWFWCLGLRWF